jgi:hypothetical protein
MVLCGLLTGLLGLAGLTMVALLASEQDHVAGLSVTVPADYASVLKTVRAVCADGVIRGTSEYDSEETLGGATESATTPLYPRWEGPGEAFYKTRGGAIAPSHFKGSRDRGAVAVRYVVDRAASGQTRLVINAVYVEDSHHGLHLSQGTVEKAEFDEIVKRLTNSGALGNGSPVEAPGPRKLARAVPEASPREVGPDRPEAATPAVKEGQGGQPGRTYPRNEAELRKALQELGAFHDGTLPVLEGFAVVGVDLLPRYDRPYYRFRVGFEPAAEGRTTLRIEAVVTARFADAAGLLTEYRSIPSNGRLEADLFERLDSYLRLASGTTASGGQQVAGSGGNR